MQDQTRHRKTSDQVLHWLVKYGRLKFEMENDTHLKVELDSSWHK